MIIMKLTKIDMARIKQADKELAYKRTLEKKQDDSLKSIGTINYLNGIKNKSLNFTAQFVYKKQDYECELCQDKGYIIVKNEQGYDYSIPCKCYAKRTVRAMLEKTGMNINEYRKKTLNSFPNDRAEAIKMKQLAIDFINNHKEGDSIAFVGKSGTMKTSICIAICLELAKKYNQAHIYFSYLTEINRLKNIMYNNSLEYSEEIKKLGTCENLYIDDLFKKQKAKDDNSKIDVTNADIKIMYEIINQRYINRKTTLFSSEFTISEIINNVDEALGSRIFEMCCNGKYGMICNDYNRRLPVNK